MRDTQLYKEDLIGIKTMDEAGKIKLNSFVGNHLQFSDQFWNTEVLPYLVQ